MWSCFHGLLLVVWINPAFTLMLHSGLTLMLHLNLGVATPAWTDVLTLFPCSLRLLSFCCIVRSPHTSSCGTALHYCPCTIQVLPAHFTSFTLCDSNHCVMIHPLSVTSTSSQSTARCSCHNHKVWYRRCKQDSGWSSKATMQCS